MSAPAGATVGEAVRRSGILERFPELDAEVLDVAVHGVRVAPEQVLASGDRVEILRPLKVDPKESRRRRAQRSR